MYPGAMPMKAAARRPAAGVAISVVNLYCQRIFRQGQGNGRPGWAQSRTPVSCSGNDLSYSQISSPSSQARKDRRQHDTHIPYIHRHIDHVQEIPNEARGNHEAWIDGSADGAAEGVPCGRVEPVPEFLFIVSEVAKAMRRMEDGDMDGCVEVGV